MNFIYMKWLLSIINTSVEYVQNFIDIFTTNIKPTVMIEMSFIYLC